MSDPATNGDAAVAPEAATNGDAAAEPDVTANGDASEHVDVKPDIQIKSEFNSKFQFKDVKNEPEDPDGDKREGRRTRKVKKPSLAEISDSGESESEPPKKRGRPSVGKKATAAKPTKQTEAAIVRNGLDPNKSARIVLENIDAEIATPPAKPGRGRAKATPASAGRGRGRGRGSAAKQKPKEVSEEEDEDEIEDESDGPEDFEDLSDESEDEWVDKKKKKKPPKVTTPVAVKKKGGKGRPPKKAVAEKEDQELDDEEEDEIPPTNDATVNDLSGPVRTGQFMIEKVDLKRQENYPIWRMEGPNMLRKFEMIMIDGKVRHKSLYAYSSWAQSMLDLYTRIQVEQLANADGEITVEVKDGYEPTPPSLEDLESKYGGDELVEPYKVFMKALFNQAADSQFLSGIRENADSSYLDPISKFDTLICQVVKRIESEVNMKEEFMTRVKNCPNMKSIKRENWSQTDQATVDKVTEKGVRSVLMFGYGYDPFLMTEDSSRGVEVAQEIIIGNTMEKYLSSYHGLIHFKYNMLKRCEDKLKKEKGASPNLNEEQVLNKCADDKGWILQTFEQLKNLMAV